MKTVIVTRHLAFIAHLQEIGLAPDDAEIITHATPEAVRGAHVIGMLPLHLAAEAAQVTTVPLNVPTELRGQELTIEQVREFAGEPESFVVHRAAAWRRFYNDACEAANGLLTPPDGAATENPRYQAEVDAAYQEAVEAHQAAHADGWNGWGDLTHKLVARVRRLAK